jgi:hypothetical protein
VNSERIRLAALVVALGLACTVTCVTASSFLVTGGSDFLVEIHSVPWANRLFTLTLVACAWIASVALPFVAKWPRWVLRILGLAALAFSTHVVVFNGVDGVLEERWFLVRCERAQFNRAEGLSYDWASRRSALGVVLTHRRDGRRRTVFTGFAPWHLDIESSLQVHGL